MKAVWHSHWEHQRGALRVLEMNSESSEVMVVDPGEVQCNTTEPSEKPLTTSTSTTKKCIHFTDGDVLVCEENESTSETRTNLENVPSQDKLDMKRDKSNQSWPEWIFDLGYRGGSKTLEAMESVGNKLTYMLGITTPKYNAEIQEYLRSQQEKKTEEDDLNSWTVHGGDTMQNKQPGKYYELPLEEKN